MTQHIRIFLRLTRHRAVEGDLDDERLAGVGDVRDVIERALHALCDLAIGCEFLYIVRIEVGEKSVYQLLVCD
jgi:hypothetical protein